MYPSSRPIEVFAPDRRPEEENAFTWRQGLAVRLPTILKQTEVLIFFPRGAPELSASGRRAHVGGPPAGARVRARPCPWSARGGVCEGAAKNRVARQEQEALF